MEIGMTLVIAMIVWGVAVIDHHHTGVFVVLYLFGHKLTIAINQPAKSW